MEVKKELLDRLSNTMRIYNERSTMFHKHRLVDEEEAINNLDRAFEAKLEAFHSIYDVTKNELDYFAHADTALLIMLRNAIHHKDHPLFRSWNYEMHLNSGMTKYSGATFLLVSHVPIDGSKVSEYYYKIEDVYDRIDDERSSDFLANKMGKPKRRKLLDQINNELNISSAVEFSVSKRYPLSQTYINIIPIYISAMSKVFNIFEEMGVQVKGFDAETYSEHFTSKQYVDLEKLSYKELKLP